MTTAWCNSLSSNAVATTGSPKTSPHSAKPRFEVRIMAPFRAARFPAVKSFDTFDFTAIPSLNKMLVLELARCG